MIFRTIVAYCCPCEVCAGEMVGDPEVGEFSSLRAALDNWTTLPPCGEDLGYGHDGPEPSCWPNAEQARSWRFAAPVAGRCEFGGEDLIAWESSLHLPNDISPSSRARINRLIERNWK